MAAGLGTRMRSQTPKHLHPVLGRRLVDWVIGAARTLDPTPLVVVTSPTTVPELEGTLPDEAVLAVQEEPRGTGDAVVAAHPALEGFDGDVLILAGDAPLLSGDELHALAETHRAEGVAATVLSFEPADPGAYGRIVRDESGRSSSRSGRSTPPSTSSPPTRFGQPLRTSTPTTHRESSTSRTRCGTSSMTAGPLPCTVRPTHVSAKA
jgi:bifunctional N-acetylglucosamine-1-phosphate-uridyltransferase/glucosamine-1-phosphate-acetyltransferase GlmU-like protein